MDFSNRTALITGSGQGVGEGIARALASNGANVCLVGRTLSKVEAVADDIFWLLFSNFKRDREITCSAIKKVFCSESQVFLSKVG